MDLYDGQQVRKLCIRNLAADTQLVTILLAYFPRVGYLEFDGDPYGYTTEMETDNMKAVAKNWKNYVESIVDSLYHTNMAMRLIEAVTFDCLASL